MSQRINTKNKIIDFFLITGRQGGVENVINKLGPFLVKQGWTVRIIQVLKSPIDWPDQALNRIYLYTDTQTFIPTVTASEYSKLLLSTPPDIILATGWPMTCTICKQAVLEANTNIPIISYVHNSIKFYTMSAQGSFSDLKYADYHFAISDTIQNEITNNIPTAITARVYNPIDIPCINFLPDSLSENPQHKKRLIYVGRLASVKRIDIILQALSQVKDHWHLDIFGSFNSDINEDSFKILVNLLDINNCITMHPWTTDPWSCCHKPDYSIMASDSEGFPLSLLESLAHGIPVITTPVSGSVEIVKPGFNGYLIPHDDIDFLANLLMALYNDQLPNIHAETCKSSIDPYYSQNALNDFNTKLLQIKKEA